MRHIAVLALTISAVTSASAAAPAPMPVVTITDIGRPYTVINGSCKFQILSNESALFARNFVNTIWEEATNKAVVLLSEDAKKAGGDAIVGLQISMSSSTATALGSGTNLSGVMACGTVVKLN